MKTGFWTNDAKQRFALKIFMGVLGVAVVTVSVVMLATKSVLYSNYNSQFNDYLFMAGTAAIFVVQMFLPALAEKIFRIKISPIISFTLILHCFCGTFLGNAANLFYIIPEWDKYMHFLTGINLSMIVLGAAQHLHYNKNGGISPLFTAGVVLLVGVGLSALWEVFEFTADVLFDMNMQGYSVDGELLVGHKAIINTMVDIIANIAGSLVVAILTYISFKFNKEWHKSCQINRKNTAKTVEQAEIEE